MQMPVLDNGKRFAVGRTVNNNIHIFINSYVIVEIFYNKKCQQKLQCVNAA